MKFNVPGKNLSDQLQAVSKVLNSKNALQILDNFLFSIEGNMLTITGSDQENTLQATVEIYDSECDGKICLPAKALLEVVKEVSSQPLTFVINDNTKEVDLLFLNGHFQFMGIDAVNYPQKEEKADGEDGVVEFSVPASEVQRAIEMTLYAVSTEPIRPMMTGIFWDIMPDKIVFVSSDTHKLVRYTNSESAPNIEKQFILPSKPASILKNIIGKEDTDIKITVDTKSANFSFANFSLSSRLIKGSYPNYNRVIPSDNPYKLTVDRQSLLNALRRVSIFASKASFLVKLSISENQILISGQDLDYSTFADEKVECAYEGSPMTIGFNAQFAIEVLANMSGDTVLVELSSPGRPGVFSPLVQKENEEVVTIQMPMQVLE